MNSLRKKNVTKMENAYVVQQEKKSSNVYEEETWIKTPINFICSLCSHFYGVGGIHTTIPK